MLYPTAVAAVVLLVLGVTGLVVWSLRSRRRREIEQYLIDADALRALLEPEPKVVVFDVRQPLDLLAHSEMIPGARFEVMQGCGHWPQYEDPKTFNRLHIDFLVGR